MRILKVLSIPAAMAFAPGASLAAPASPGGAPEQARSAAEATPVDHRGWRYDRGHGRYHRYRPYRPYSRGYRYYYGPRCYWSRYWHRTVCR